jgi:BASS family bile acid:Na+ symporter
MVVWLFIVCAVGYFFPRRLIVLKPYLEYFFMFTMLGIGFVLNTADFIPIVKKPHRVLLGTLSQFLIMPFLGWFFAMALMLPRDITVGLILTGAAPGAMASNVISYLAKADVAYSIALTTASTFLAPVLTPSFTYIYAKTFINIPFWPMFWSIVKMVILPLATGLTAKHFLQEKFEKIKGVFPALSTVFIAFICGLVLALNRDYIQQITWRVFLAVFCVNGFGMALGYLSGMIYGFDTKRKRTLAFEVGMQNAGLGAVLALKHFSPQAALPNAIFAIWCIVTASVLANYWSRR